MEATITGLVGLTLPAPPRRLVDTRFVAVGVGDNHATHREGLGVMDKERLWKIYVDRNPCFLTDGASFTAAGLRKFFDQTWDAGHDQGIANGRVLGADSERKRTSGSLARNLDKIFGGP